MISTILVPAVLGFLTLLNIVVPLSGSATVTALLAIFTDPHQAVGLAAFFFVLSGVIRISVFHQELCWDYVRKLFIPSIFGAVLGAFFIAFINAQILLSLVLLAAVYFLLKKLKIIKKSKKEVKHGATLLGGFSGFLQGGGLPGSDIRNSYLLSEGLTIAQLHGTTAVVGMGNFLTTVVVFLHQGKLAVPDLLPILYLIPVILIGTIAGKFVLLKIPEKVSNGIVVSVMVGIIILLTGRIIGVI